MVKLLKQDYRRVERIKSLITDNYDEYGLNGFEYSEKYVKKEYDGGRISRRQYNELMSYIEKQKEKYEYQDIDNYYDKMRHAYNSYYVSHYVEYPIYEPAQGGYYYAGNQLQDSEKFTNYEQAIEYARDWAEQLGLQQYGQGENISWRKPSKYVGQSESIVIQPIKGMNEQGWRPYQ